MTGNIKRLIAIDKKYHEAPVYICAKEDPRTKTLVDYEGRLSANERKELSVKIDGDTQLRVSHLMQFDLDNPNDKIYFEIISDDKMVAPSKEEVNPGSHRYYIEDKEYEARVSISKTRLKAQAFKVVALLSLEDMVNYARILGKYASDLSATQVEALLYDKCEDKPKEIIDISTDRDLKYKILLNKLLDNNFITSVNGKYMNGTEVVGISEDFSIQWLKDPKNSAVVTQWISSFSGFESPNVAAIYEDHETKSIEEPVSTVAVKSKKRKGTKAKIKSK